MVGKTGSVWLVVGVRINRKWDEVGVGGERERDPHSHQPTRDR